MNVNWQAVSAVATFSAVVVALVPIWREAIRFRACARSLRFRLCSNLTILRPSLLVVVKKGATGTQAAILSPEEFRGTVRSIANKMQEASVLNEDEQDQLGVVLANLEMAAVLYDHIVTVFSR